MLREVYFSACSESNSQQLPPKGAVRQKESPTGRSNKMANLGLTKPVCPKKFSSLSDTKSLTSGVNFSLPKLFIFCGFLMQPKDGKIQTCLIFPAESESLGCAAGGVGLSLTLSASQLVHVPQVRPKGDSPGTGTKRLLFTEDICI